MGHAESVLLNSEQEARSFELWKNSIEKRTGVLITPDRERALRVLLERRIRERGHEDLEDYLVESLCAVNGAEEWGQIVDALLIKETGFFRHKPSIDYVRWHVMSMVRRGMIDGPFWAWSLGCSTGEESFSLAIAIDQAMRAAGVEPRFGVVGTDISGAAILQARRAIFRDSRMATLGDAVKQQYFDQVGKGLWRAGEYLRRKVCFVRSNVLTDPAPLKSDKLHLIFSQNMLIYFRRWKRREIVNQLTETLDPHGSLVIGIGEINNWAPRGFIRVRPRGVQAYIRDADGRQN